MKSLLFLFLSLVILVTSSCSPKANSQVELPDTMLSMYESSDLVVIGKSYGNVVAGRTTSLACKITIAKKIKGIIAGDKLSFTLGNHSNCADNVTVLLFLRYDKNSNTYPVTTNSLAGVISIRDNEIDEYIKTIDYISELSACRSEKICRTAIIKKMLGDDKFTPIDTALSILECSWLSNDLEFVNTNEIISQINKLVNHKNNRIAIESLDYLRHHRNRSSLPYLVDACTGRDSERATMIFDVVEQLIPSNDKMFHLIKKNKRAMAIDQRAGLCDDLKSWWTQNSKGGIYLPKERNND